eukprot:TRINITY_DN5190_c0_g1_i2.p1 TRINITY_DN5190_c0_g1~~TRINITY_DN5190_c0_g1_i2.p1  ORF type:complete len:747 (+),score=309.57 TRINITY_DN5190_c0_g1_i2:29-2269(+)
MSSPQETKVADATAADDLSSVRKNLFPTASAQPNRLEVFLRLRPVPETTELSVSRIDARRVMLRDKLREHGAGTEFEFDGVLGPNADSTEEETKENSDPENDVDEEGNKPVPSIKQANAFSTSGSQRSVYKTIGLPLVKALFEGRDALLAAYGSSGSGKTHTIQGNTEDPKDRGIIPRILSTIFESINMAGKSKATINKNNDHDHVVLDVSDEYKYFIWMSYYEVYNEKVFDLLAPQDKKEALKVKEDKSGRIFVRDITEQTLTSVEDGKKWLNEGLGNRRVAETCQNRDSSRSHSILTIKIAQIPKKASKEELHENPKLVKYSRLSIVDLAGSERANKTKTAGDRMREASHINKSLMTLGMCIETMRYNQLHPKQTQQQVVPFRQSQLTRLLQDYFTGNAKAVMIINVNPRMLDYEETLQVLKFAAVAKTVVTTTAKKRVVAVSHTAYVPGQARPAAPTVPQPAPATPPNVEMGEVDTDQVIDELLDQIDSLRRQVVESELKATEVEMRVRGEASNELAARLSEFEQIYEERLEQELSLLDAKYQRKIKLAIEMSRAEQSESQGPSTAETDRDTNEADRLQGEVARLHDEVAARDAVIEQLRKELAAQQEATTRASESAEYDTPSKKMSFKKKLKDMLTPVKKLKRKEPATNHEDEGGAKKKQRTEGQFNCMSPQGFSPVTSPNKENEEENMPTSPQPARKITVSRAKRQVEEEEESDVEPAVVTRVGKTPISRRLRRRAPTKAK